MDISARQIGKIIMEITVTTCNANIKEDVSNINGYISEDLIENLRDIANDFEEFNKINGHI